MNIRNTLTLLALAAISSTARAQDGLKIYISADMEGVVGVVTDDQLGPGGFEYERFRQFMTHEVNAAIDAARAAGATEFVVSDSHGNGQNLLIEQLPDDVTVIRSWPRYKLASVRRARSSRASSGIGSRSAVQAASTRVATQRATDWVVRAQYLRMIAEFEYTLKLDLPFWTFSRP